LGSKDGKVCLNDESDDDDEECAHRRTYPFETSNVPPGAASVAVRRGRIQPLGGFAAIALLACHARVELE
ncbi:MAG TPA: hypothetical protein VK116_11550, partial [Planctomycetota bacterium]|nr:hypothetical protein [Planctomycetota bacterium]